MLALYKFGGLCVEVVSSVWSCWGLGEEFGLIVMLKCVFCFRMFFLGGWFIVFWMVIEWDCMLYVVIENYERMC